MGMKTQQAECADAGMTKQAHAVPMHNAESACRQVHAGTPKLKAARPHTSTLCRSRPFSASFSEIVAMAAARVVSASLMLASSLNTCG